MLRIDHDAAVERLKIRDIGKMLIGGQWVESSSRETFAVTDPSTGKEIARVAQASAADVDQAYRKAKEAFPGWKKLNPNKRKECMVRLAELTNKHRDELAELESIDSGFPMTVTKAGSVKSVVRNLEYYASWIDKLTGEVNPLPSGDALDYTLREPLGVIAALSPWNVPILFCGSKIAPALAAGNTVVMKPSENAPLSSLKWAELIEKSGIPPGVINIISGDGRTGAMLVEHPIPAKVSFTGGVETGKRVMELASKSLKRVMMELGGKSPQIVCADAPLQKTGMLCGFGVFACTGQMCTAGSRIFIEAPIYDRFVESFVEFAQGLPIGDPLDESTIIGPVNSERHLQRILGFVESGKKEGARLLWGGDRVEGPGNFIRPAIFADARPDMKVAREEIFGPVTCLFKFDDLQEALRIANDTPYGLAAGVWTSDVKKAHTLARELEAGNIWINTYNMLSYTTPFGGTKASGFGREGGRHGIEEYTQIKNVYLDLS